jgi:hypothetical protein
MSGRVRLGVGVKLRHDGEVVEIVEIQRTHAVLRDDEETRNRAVKRAGHVREVLFGYRSGSPELARQNEPRPE